MAVNLLQIKLLLRVEMEEENLGLYKSLTLSWIISHLRKQEMVLLNKNLAG